ncbi:MAG: hypothetical protein J2P18_01225 [Nocardia sp.]|nr:hypothetical protein [Nocardia sp.]
MRRTAAVLALAFAATAFGAGTAVVAPQPAPPQPWGKPRAIDPIPPQVQQH